MRVTQVSQRGGPSARTQEEAENRVLAFLHKTLCDTLRQQMSRATTDPMRSAEAKQELADGEKCLKTSAFKWKPDYLSAEPHFQKAGRAFKAAGMMDSAVEAWKKAAFCSVKMGNTKQASITLESIAKELVSVWGLLEARGR